MLQYQPEIAKRKYPLLQPKLKIGAPGDRYEREADAVADHVMSMPEGESLRMQPLEEEEEMMMPKLQMQPKIQMQCPACRQGEGLQLQAKANTGQMSPVIQRSGDGALYADASFSNRLQSRSGLGQPLPESINKELGGKFGADFSEVRVHTDSKAVEMNRELGARAFTHGRDIYFGVGQYNSQSIEGKGLLAHELTHVIQQTQSEPVVQREAGDNTGQQQPTEIEFNFNVTPQIRWALIALLIRPIAEEGTWACLAGRGEYDAPRILHNYFIRYRGNSSLDQIYAQQPANVDRDRYIQTVMQFLWSSIREDFMRMAVERMSRNAEFRRRVEEAATGRGCSTVPYIPPGSGAAAV